MLVITSMIILCNMVLCGSQSPEKVIQVWQNFRKQNTIDHRTGHCKMHCMALWWECPYLGLWPESAIGQLSRTSGLSLHPPVWDSIPKGKASSPNLHPWRPRAHKLPFGVLVPKEREWKPLLVSAWHTSGSPSRWSGSGRQREPGQEVLRLWPEKPGCWG